MNHSQHRFWITELHKLLYSQLGRLAVDIPASSHTATPMVSLADIKQVLNETLDKNPSAYEETS